MGVNAKNCKRSEKEFKKQATILVLLLQVIQCRSTKFEMRICQVLFNPRFNMEGKSQIQYKCKHGPTRET